MKASERHKLKENEFAQTVARTREMVEQRRKEVMGVVIAVIAVTVVIGGYLAWRWHRTIWLHLALAGWGFSTIVFGFNCPLTYVEDWARKHAGERGLSTGFIDTYLEGVIYPQSMAGAIQALGAVIVAVSWIGAFILWRRRRALAPSPMSP